MCWPEDKSQCGNLGIVLAKTTIAAWQSEDCADWKDRSSVTIEGLRQPK
jgi:hypothetical protein